MKTTQHWHLVPARLSAFPEQFYSTGGKFTHLRQYYFDGECHMMAYLKEEEPFYTVTGRHFELYCQNFFNRSKTSKNTKIAKIEKFFLLKLDSN